MKGRYLGLLALSGLILGCSTNPVKHENVCSEEWYQWVEEKVSTGDGMGHGPDPGSQEWRSVVEFRLGLRDQGVLPDRSTDEWCRAVDRYLKDNE